MGSEQTAKANVSALTWEGLLISVSGNITDRVESRKSYNIQKESDGGSAGFPRNPVKPSPVPGSRGQGVGDYASDFR